MSLSSNPLKYRGFEHHLLVQPVQNLKFQNGFSYLSAQVYQNDKIYRLKNQVYRLNNAVLTRFVELELFLIRITELKPS